MENSENKKKSGRKFKDLLKSGKVKNKKVTEKSRKSQEIEHSEIEIIMCLKNETAHRMLQASVQQTYNLPE